MQPCPTKRVSVHDLTNAISLPGLKVCVQRAATVSAGDDSNHEEKSSPYDTENLMDRLPMATESPQ